jgi:hypothetical protein
MGKTVGNDPDETVRSALCNARAMHDPNNVEFFQAEPF